MKFSIEHIAIWVEDLEKTKDFYVKYFGGKVGEVYFNEKKGFRSYFVSFSSGARLELMNRGLIPPDPNQKQEVQGITHFAFEVENQAAVDKLTETLREDGFTIAGEPRHTGDGFYESVVLDPEKNRLEIMAI